MFSVLGIKNQISLFVFSDIDKIINVCFYYDIVIFFLLLMLNEAIRVN